MKKFYTLLMSAMLTTSAMAITPKPSTGNVIKGLNDKIVERTTNRMEQTSYSSRLKVGEHGDIDPVTPEEPETQWVSLGTGTFTEAFILPVFGYDPDDYETEIEEDAARPGRYRLVDPYKYVAADFGYSYTNGQYMIVNAEDPTAVYIEDDCETGFVSPTYGAFSILLNLNIPGFIEQGYPAATVQQVFGCLGTCENGVIKFTSPTYVGSDGNTYYALLGQFSNYNGYFAGNKAGKFKIVLPSDKDYTLTVTSSFCNDDNEIPFTIVAGEDIADIRFTILKGDYPAKGNEEIAANLESIEPGTYTLNADVRAKFSLLAFGLDADGNVVATADAYAYGVHDEAEDWEYYGIGQYNEPFIHSLYQQDEEIYDVVIEKNKNSEGDYRIVNPFEGCALSQYNASEHVHNHYLYFNIADPEGVYIEDAPYGTNFGDGNSAVSSLAYLYLNGGNALEDIKGAGFCGTYNEETGIVNIPGAKLLFAEDNYKNGQWYTIGRDFNLTISKDTSAIDQVSIDNMKEAEYFNLQGIRVQPKSGELMIVRKGNNVTKTIVK